MATNKGQVIGGCLNLRASATKNAVRLIQISNNTQALYESSLCLFSTQNGLLDKRCNTKSTVIFLISYQWIFLSQVHQQVYLNTLFLS